MPYLSATRENSHSDSRLKLFNGLFRWKKTEKEKQKARQLSKSEVCIATSMSVKTRNSCPASPALSMPRSRDVFQDMEALTISRHDNPYLQKKILASRESLLDDNIVISETDDIDIMAQEYLADMGPGALIELHQHMVRSPPPTTWPRIPIFKYDEKDQSQDLYGDRCKSPHGRSFLHSSCSKYTRWGYEYLAKHTLTLREFGAFFTDFESQYNTFSKVEGGSLLIITSELSVKIRSDVSYSTRHHVASLRLQQIGGSSSCVVSPRYNYQSRCHRSASESRGKHV